MLVGLIAAVACLLLAYAARVAILGRFEHDRAKKEPGSVFLGRYFIECGYWIFSPLEKAAVTLGVTPNQLTAASLACSIAGAVGFALGRPAMGGALVLACAVFDALDGMVARTRGTASEAGEVLDAAVDRYAEVLTFAGIAAYYRAMPVGLWLALGSLGGALLVSYARAKGEISGIDARMGSMNRGERALYTGFAGLLSPDVARWLEPRAEHPTYHALLFTLALIAVMANVTAVRRFLFTYRELRKRQPGAVQVRKPEPKMAGWFGRAGVASAAATAVDYGTFTLLVEGFGVFTGTATAEGALLGAITNFSINKAWTFRTQKVPLWVELPRYAAISLTSLLLNTGGVVALAEGMHLSPLFARAVVGIAVSVGWNLPLHRYFVFRGEETSRRSAALTLLGAFAAGSAAVAVLLVAYGVPFAAEGVHGFSIHLPDTANITRESFLPKLRRDAFYSESYTFLFEAEDGTFARVEYLVSNEGVSEHGRAEVRAVVVPPGEGATVEDAESFEPGGWSVRPEGAIELRTHSLTMGPDASHHLHFGGKRLVFDATVLPETRAVRPGGGRIVFDPAARAVVDETIFALRSRFEATLWTPEHGTHRLRGFCYADTSYSTVPQQRSAALAFRMEAFDDREASGQAAALTVLYPPQGGRVGPQGWLYTTGRSGEPLLRSSEVALHFTHLLRPPGALDELPQAIHVEAKGAQGEKVSLELEATRLLHRRDPSESEGFLRRLLTRGSTATTYTYEDRYTLRIERAGQPVEERRGTALTEFSFAKRGLPQEAL